ncbi:hypothetical protein AVEN_158600-1 [Araneus ventricosus]|uniref:Uncharacterized protein n=1 Tax=Araneus ventricosus TaxID=182803 RepID=A0A4Y2JJK2_ARAVE|nr:hypothetical protein AVEN_158600-1 [Araneus ventricosus]
MWVWCTSKRPPSGEVWKSVEGVPVQFPSSNSGSKLVGRYSNSPRVNSQLECPDSIFLLMSPRSPNGRASSPKLAFSVESCQVRAKIKPVRGVKASSRMSSAPLYRLVILGG